MNESENVEVDSTAICERLKAVRIQVCGIRGQSHFAALLQLSPSTYNYYEKGRVPPVSVLDRASRLTEAPLLWLIRGEPADFEVHQLRKLGPQPRGDRSENVNGQSEQALRNGSAASAPLHQP